MRNDWVEIDGGQGEGGGQIVRSALGLSMATGRPFRLRRIRAGRKRPGLMRQHLTAVEASAQLCSADVSGAEIGAMELSFAPGMPNGGEHHFSVGTAGSANLVLQAVLPGLLAAQRPSSVRIEGGTHNPWAPPSDFLSRTFAPRLRDMGVGIDLTLERHGFYPAGGGSVKATITPPRPWRPLELLERGPFEGVDVEILLAGGVPRRVAERQEQIVRRKLDVRSAEIREVDSLGPGNAVLLAATSGPVTEIATGFGEIGKASEVVLKRPIASVRHLLQSPAPVGEHLADQLLVPMALGAGGVFRTHNVSRHTRTNVDVIQRFLDVDITIEKEDRNAYLIRVRTGGAS